MKCSECPAKDSEFCTDTTCFKDSGSFEKEIKKRLLDVERQFRELERQKEFIEGRMYELTEILDSIGKGAKNG